MIGTLDASYLILDTGTALWQTGQPGIRYLELYTYKKIETTRTK
jgi:hypothetical protein